MKNALSIAFGFILICSVHSCQPECNYTQANTAYLFIDHTDTLNYRRLQESWKRDMEQLNHRMFPFSPCTGGAFKAIIINSIGSNPSGGFAYGPLPARLNDFSPPPDYQQFFREKYQAMEKATAFPPRDLPRSLIYEPACRHLAELAEQPLPGRKLAVFYSDMLENSQVDFYNIRKDNEMLLAELEQAFGCQMPNLEGIDIIIVNHRSQETDALIRRANQFWQWLFERNNARSVHSGSSLVIGGPFTFK